jgi:hypothetical protein
LERLRQKYKQVCPNGYQNSWFASSTDAARESDAKRNLKRASEAAKAAFGWAGLETRPTRNQVSGATLQFEHLFMAP